MGYKFNVFTGNLDLVEGSGSDSENFSYEEVITTKTLLVPSYQQMIVSGTLKVDGVITVDGAIVMIN